MASENNWNLGEERLVRHSHEPRFFLFRQAILTIYVSTFCQKNELVIIPYSIKGLLRTAINNRHEHISFCSTSSNLRTSIREHRRFLRFLLIMVNQRDITSFAVLFCLDGWRPKPTFGQIVRAIFFEKIETSQLSK